jgi:hypothetical protein
MKKIIVLLFVSILVTNCSKNDATSQSEILKQAIQGKWQLTSQTYFDPENPNGGPHVVQNGHFFKFETDGRFISKSYDDQIVVDGVYSITNDSIITFRYNDNFGLIVVNRIRELNQTTLNLDGDVTPDNSACFEGCANIYTKRPND